jgi:HAD superfamily hydrolase (TIGR01549 family)
VASPFRAVLFDLDGVLVDSYEVWLHVLNAVARELGYPAVSREVFAAGWGQGIEADVERFYPRHSVAEIEARYAAAYREHLAHLRYDPAARVVLETLRGRGLRTAMVTNTPGDIARAIAVHGGLVFDAVVGGTDVARGKPAPDVVLRACEHVGVAPPDAVVVGDTAYDRDAARAAGAAFAGFRFGDHPRLERLQEVLHWVEAVGSG